MTELEIIKSIIFYGFAFATVFFAIITIFAPKIMYALIFSVIVFFATSGIFFMLGADYNAVIQIAIYGVTIPVLFALAIMFVTEHKELDTNITKEPRLFFSIIGVGGLLLVILYSFIITISVNPDVNWIMQKQTAIINKYQMFTALAKGLYVNYMLAFEAFAFLLLVIIIGISTFNIIKERKRG